MHSNGPIFLLDDAAVGRLGHDLVGRAVAAPRRRRHRRRHRRRSGGGRGPLAEARGHILGLHGVAALPVGGNKSFGSCKASCRKPLLEH